MTNPPGGPGRPTHPSPHPFEKTLFSIFDSEIQIYDAKIQLYGAKTQLHDDKTQILKRQNANI